MPGGPPGPPGPPGPQVPFADRADAGKVLGAQVARCKDLVEPVVVALPRGGVPVGAGVARALGAPLVVMPVGKVGAPGHEELAVGAVAPGGVVVINDAVVATLGLGPGDVEILVAKAQARLAAQARSFGGVDELALAGRSVVVVDDGLATGATMSAALGVVRKKGPRRLVMAVAVASPEVLRSLAPLVDEVVCPVRPRHMQSVGSWYRDFTQTTDGEVARLLGELGPGARRR